MERFRRSMRIGREEWHDGIGYDLEALCEASPGERLEIERLLTTRGARDWRDVQALAALDSAGARQALEEAFARGRLVIRLAVLRHAPGVVTREQRASTLVAALERAGLEDGLSWALDEVPSFHPPPVVEALLHGVMHREGEVAVHLAAMLAFLHGAASEPFDMDQRPFFLRFHTGDPGAREAVFRELCARIGIDPDAVGAR